MTMGRRRGLKSWFVEPYLQVRLGIWFLTINCVFAGLIFAVYGYYVIEVYRAVVMYFKISGAESVDVFAKFRVPLAVGIGLIFAFILTTIMASVRLTHGFYGPLISIHRFLDEALSGRLPEPIHLRDSDQLQDIANKLNKFRGQLSIVQDYDSSKGQLKAIQLFLNQILEGKDPRLEGGDHDFMLADIAKKIRRIKSGS